MTDDLVRQLRCYADIDDAVYNPWVYGEAADRIEKLEAALREIIDERGICGHCGQLATGEGKRSFVICDKTVLGFKGPCHWTPQDPKDIARKALEGKDD
jgi:hypothetical protein